MAQHIGQWSSSPFMPQVRQYQEPLGTANWTSNAMVNAFGHDCGGQRMLRGEQLYRTSKVTSLAFNRRLSHTFISAKVLSQDHRSNAPGGAYTTTIQIPALSAAETLAASDLLVKSSAWAPLMRQCQSGVLPWQPCFHRQAEQLIKALQDIPLVPNVWSQCATATCTCHDFMPNKWCKHVAAIAYDLIGKCEGDPFYPFILRQLDMKSICDRPAKRARDQPIAPNKAICVIIDDHEEHGTSVDRPIIL